MTQSKSTIPEGFCQCGCGERTRISTSTHRALADRPNRYIMGHNCAKAPFYTVDAETGCWNWQRRVTGKRTHRYGTIKRNGQTIMAHRYFWERVNGPIPEGLVIHHRCENTRCVNPDHLQVVTPHYNTYVGNRTKLTIEQVAEIRSLAATMTQTAIAERFGVTQGHINNILCGRDRIH